MKLLASSYGAMLPLAAQTTLIEPKRHSSLRLRNKSEKEAGNLVDKIRTMLDRLRLNGGSKARIPAVMQLGFGRRWKRPMARRPRKPTGSITVYTEIKEGLALLHVLLELAGSARDTDVLHDCRETALVRAKPKRELLWTAFDVPFGSAIARNGD